MRPASSTLLALSLFIAATPASADLPPPKALNESPWNGDWALSRTRNAKAIQDQAAEGYRFHLSPDGAIRWEIPTLDEVVEGRADGQAMRIKRPGADDMTLAVSPEGPFTLRYTVTRGGQPFGEGRMTLVEYGQAWVDISQPYGRPDLAHVVIYVRPRDADR